MKKWFGLHLRFRYKLGIIVVTLLSVFLWGRCSKPKLVAPGVLPKDVKEQIIIDPRHNTLTIVRPNERSHYTLPDKPTVIDIKIDGTVKVTSPQWGFEHRMFIGGGITDKFRLITGFDGFYWKKVDLGLGVGVEVVEKVPIALVHVSYNVYSNIRLGIMYDTRKNIGVLATIRI